MVGVEVKIVPPAKDWVNGELKTSQIKVVKITVIHIILSVYICNINIFRF